MEKEVLLKWLTVLEKTEEEQIDTLYQKGILSLLNGIRILNV